METNKVTKNCYLIRQDNIQIFDKIILIEKAASTYLFVSVALICLALHLKKKILSKMCILYCLVLLNKRSFFNLASIYIITLAVVTCFRSGARCSSVVRAFTHGAMGRRIDPSWGEPIDLFLVPASAP